MCIAVRLGLLLLLRNAPSKSVFGKALQMGVVYRVQIACCRPCSNHACHVSVHSVT